jgi:UPF0716 family protein affecting phage T7 exclusion
MKNLGITLLVVVMTVFTGFNLVTRKKVVDMGSVQITSNEKTPVYWSPIVGGVVAAAGLLILVANKKK